jgi:hypothetical protein
VTPGFIAQVTEGAGGPHEGLAGGSGPPESQESWLLFLSPPWGSCPSLRLAYVLDTTTERPSLTIQAKPPEIRTTIPGGVASPVSCAHRRTFLSK